MLAAGAHAEVQRRLTGLGVQRALGFGPGRIAAQQSVEAALVAIPAAVARHHARRADRRATRRGAARGAERARPGPTGMLLGPLALVARAPAWSRWSSPPRPGRRWRAARRPPVEILRGGDLARHATAAAAAAPGGGLFALGVRFATAARGRWFAAVATIAVCAGVVTLMLALASLLERLREDPGHGRQALPARGAARPDPDPRGRGAAGRAGRRRALLDRRRGLVPARGADPARRLPRRPHALREPAARRGAAHPRARTRSRSASAWPTRSACGPARRSPRRSPTAARSASRSPASCARSRTTGGSPGSSRTS